MLSRRRLVFGLTFPLLARFGGRANATALLQVDRLLRVETLRQTQTLQRHYRADATIYLFSVPILRRSNVGSGTVALGEAREANRRRTSLRFAAGSLPERARGLNRLGYLHEVVIEEDDELREAAYFGFITASPEDSLTDAKKALGSTGKGDLPYTIIDASVTANKSRSSVAHLLFPPKYNWSDIGTLVGAARQHAHSADAAWRESNWPDGAQSFLYVLANAMRAGDGKSVSQYVYGEKRYQLTVEKSKDTVQGRYFQQAGLTKSADSIRLCKGEILNRSSGQKTPFQVWVEDGAADARMPLRIEFQPKSYLRLSFEWDDSVPAPAV